MRSTALQRPSYEEVDDDSELLNDSTGSLSKKNSTQEIEDDEEEIQFEPVGMVYTTEEKLSIEKILGRKIVTDADGVQQEMFLVKWKKFSYLHVSWESRDELIDIEPQAKLKLKRFLQTPQPRGVLGDTCATKRSDSLEEGAIIGVKATDDDEEREDEEEDEQAVEYFNSDLVEVQRIVSCETKYTPHAQVKNHVDLLLTLDCDETDGENSSANDLKYLVKWRGAPYNECSWERFEDLKNNTHEIWKFWKLQKAPRLPIKKPKFPTLAQYKKLEKSPMFGVEKVEKEQVLNLNSLSDSKLVDVEAKSPSSEDNNARGCDTGLKLRDYQLEGVNWLLWNWWHRRPCILADEMGLGKTIQTVCFLHQLRFMTTTKVPGPFLIISPLSLIDQWQSEINTWSPEMNCVLLHGNAEARDLMVKNEFYYHEPFSTRADAMALKKAGVFKFNVLLTTYEMAVKDVRILAKIEWQVCVIDEAHKLKNPASKLFQTLRTIPCSHTVLLTGTPLQNKTEELWALLNFADDVRFSDLDDFCRKFGDLKEASQVANLHDVLKPYLLRRIKEDVEKSLPPKEETIVEVALTSIQKQFYRAIFEKNTQYLFKGVKASNQPSLMNVMMELRKCCNHPYLIRGVEDRILSDLPPEAQRDENICHQKLVDSAGKLVLLQKLLPRLYSQGSKVLIFSQMVRVLNLLEDFLRHEQYTFERLDGSTRSTERKEAVDKFCNSATKTFVMLLSTKAGGLGLNLTVADTVIIYDSDWNPQNDLQAQARAHRIGQTKAVMVYRLLTRKTYEMEMFHQASMKLGLDRAVLAHARNEQEAEELENSSSSALTSSSNLKNNITTKEIDELLKRGAYDVFREDDTEQQEFQEADIDAILQRRAHKVSYDGANTAVTSSLGKFSKASFVSADEKEDVDINDPDFWQKAIGFNENTKTDLLEPNLDTTTADLLSLLVTNKRVRNQTKNFNYSEEKSVDEQQLKQLLKPLKSEKALLKSKQQEENAAKRAAERELKQKKLEQEERARNDPSVWNSHLRDRVLRALQSFGIGRWKRILQETGKGISDWNAVQEYAQSYMYQCGIAAGETEALKSDTEFVTDTINSTRKIKDLMRAEHQNALKIPPSLLDQKFLMKLKGGNAKKILTKLGYLNSLYSIMEDTIDKAYARKGVEMDRDATVDELFNSLEMEEVLDALPLGPIRPPWTRIKKWWDYRCDQHLLYGIFKYGYARYDLIKEDDSLCFKNILLVYGSCGRKKRKKVEPQQELSGMPNEHREDLGSGDENDEHDDDQEEEKDDDDDNNDDDNEVDEVEEDDHVAATGQVGSDAVHMHSSSNTDKASEMRGPTSDDSTDANVGMDVDRSQADSNNVDDDREEAELKIDMESGTKPTKLSKSVSNLTEQSSSGKKRRRGGKSQNPLGANDEVKISRAFSTETVDEYGQDNDDNDNDDNDFPEDNLDGEDAVEDDAESNDGEAKLKISASTNSLSTSALAMPDARSLNRLLAWLVSSDVARMSQEEYNEKHRTRHRARMTMEFASSQQDLKGVLDDHGKEEFNSDNVVMSPFQFANVEERLLSLLAGLLDPDAIATVMKANVKGLMRCGNVILSPVAGQNVSTTGTTSSSDNGAVSVPTESDAVSSSNMQIDINDDKAATSQESSPRAFGLSNSLISNTDVLRLTSAFILYAAPIGHLQIPSIPIKVLTSIGCLPLAIRNLSVNLVTPNEREFRLMSQCFKSVSLQLFDWNRFREVSKLTLTDEVLETFYRETWLPFCYAVAQKRTLGLSNSKQVVPNPFLNIADHHYAAKGLCQIFLVRQQLVRAAHFILVHHLQLLVEYLTNTFQGRNVENMPIWWCPWTHDIALLIGILKHGYAGIGRIVDDSELPFVRSTLELHIRQMFLQGSSFIAPLGLNDISSSLAAEKFVAAALLQFPDPQVIDARIARILEDVTNLVLPSGHFCHVRSYNIVYTGAVKAPFLNSASLSNNSGNSNTRRKIAKSDGLSLKSYAKATEAERKEAVKRQHSALLAKHPESI